MPDGGFRELLLESCGLQPDASAVCAGNGPGTLDLSYQTLYAKVQGGLGFSVPSFRWGQLPATLFSDVT